MKMRSAGRFYWSGLLFTCLLLLAPASWGQSSRPGMGAIPYEGGVTFRVWAPHASSVGVIGEFNGWTPTSMGAEDGGHWSVDIPGAHHGQRYKYRIDGYGGMQDDRRDPRARWVTSSAGDSIIYDMHAFDWGDAPIPMPWRNDLVIYQMHIGTFAGKPSLPATFDDAIEWLDHVRDLGINAIKVMPVNEFAGGMSWGYNPADLFAIESDYGGPDAFKRFVKACHERGMAVFVDVVHNHYGPSDLDMWQFDGWSENDLGGIYFFNDHRAHTMWGSTRPDYGRGEVRSFIRDQIMMFVEEYRVGGFRWDSIYSTIYADGHSHMPEGEHLVRDINWELMQNHPHVVRIAEDHAFDFGMNFESQWDVDYRWGLYGQVVSGEDSERDMWTVRDLITGWAGLHRVVFSEAHDYIAANHERSRLPSMIHPDDPDSIWARKRALLAAGIVMTTPGIPMLHQGQEMHETHAFHDDTPLRWERAETFSGIVQAYKDMISARRNLRGATQGLKGTGVDVHHIDNDNKVIAFVRWDAGGMQDDVVVVANFGSGVWEGNYEIEFPAAGTWYCHFNGDDTSYGDGFGGVGGNDVHASDWGEATVDMGMYSLQIFSRQPPIEGGGLVTVDPAQPDGCVEVQIAYDPHDGVLAGSSTVAMHLGRNGWQDVQTVSMTEDGGLWLATVDVQPGTHELNFVFHDNNPDEEARRWDNNYHNDWHVVVENCGDVPPPPPDLVINYPPPNTTVSHEVSQYSIEGTAVGLVGLLTWSNAANAEAGSVAVASPWSVANIPLAVGANEITVRGRADVQEVLVWAEDEASHYEGAWSDGANQGAGFGAWALSASENSGYFIANSTEHPLNIGSLAFGLWAQKSALSEAIRPFSRAMTAGDTFSMRFQNNSVEFEDEPRQSVGLALQTASGDNVVEFYFEGGEDEYTVHDEDGGRASGISWTDQGLFLRVKLLSDTTYELSAGGQTLSGNYAGAPQRLRVWNANGGVGSAYDLFFNEMVLSEPDGEGELLSDMVTITRRPADDSTDSDGDGLPDWWELLYFGHETGTTPGHRNISGMTNWESYVSGLSPLDEKARFLVASGSEEGGGVALEWPLASGRIYTVYRSTNLMAEQGGFEPLPGAGELSNTNRFVDLHPPEAGAYYKIRVALPGEP